MSRRFISPARLAMVASAWVPMMLGPLDVSGQEGADPPPLFASTEPLAVIIRADFGTLKGDRSESPDRPAVVVVAGPDGAPVEVAAEIRTRGDFRLETCSFPPLRIDIDEDSAAGTVLEGQDDLKLVSSCRPERASWSDLVVKEYLAYRSIQMVTDASFRVRLLEATFRDTGSEEESETRVAFAIEEDEALAERLGATVFDLEEGENLPASVFDPVHRMISAVAQYMLGNPDWSDVAGHNVEILDRNGTALAIPYDFDFSGIVDAPYATPPPEYRLDSVRERYYRGWCENPLITRSVLERFREVGDEIVAMWRTEPLLAEGSRWSAAGYLEAFFDAIETNERAERTFLRDCRTVAD